MEIVTDMKAEKKPEPMDVVTGEQRFLREIGRFRNSGVKITFEQIQEARREMWAKFPREFPPPG